MSDKPKTSFLKTLGKHLVVGSASLPAVEPVPPAEPAAGPKETPEQIAAAKAAADKAAADKAAADKAAADKAAAEKAAADKAEAEKKAAAGKTDDPPPDDPEKKPKIKAKKSDPLPPVPDADLAPDAPPKEETPKSVGTLLDYQATKSEVRYLEVLQSGAEREPEKYQALLDREVDRLKKTNAWVRKWKEEHPDEEPVDESGRPVPEYARFLKANPPAIDAAEHEDLKDELRMERAKAKAKQELQQEMEPQFKKVVELEAKPVIEKAESDVEAAVMAALPEVLGKDDYLLEFAKQGVDALVKVPKEGKVFDTAIKRGKAVVGEFIKLRRGLVEMDPYNETHVFISRSVATAAEIFEEQGGAERIRKGKRFVSPATFLKLKPEARKKHWTFDDADIVETFASMTARGALQELEEKRAEDRAHEEFRKPKTPAGKPPAAKAEEPTRSSPAIAPSPTSPGGAPPPPKNARLKGMLGITAAK